MILAAPSPDPIYGEIAMFIFMAIFGGVLIYTFARPNRQFFERARHLPLDEGTPPDASRTEEEGTRR